MDDRIVEFAALLRQNGIRISPAEVTDAVRAASLAGLADRETLKAALETTMVKSAREHEVFGDLFELYFSGMKGVIDGFERSLLARIEEEGLLEGDELQMLLHEMRRMSLSPLTQALVEGDAAALLRLLRGASLQLDLAGLSSPLQTGFYARRLLGVAGATGAERDLRQLEVALRDRGLNLDRLAIVEGLLAGRLRKLEDAARQLMAEEVERRVPGRRRRGDTLARRPFAELSREEIERTAAAVRRLAEKLKSRLVRKQKSRRRGALAVRRTLRRNMGLGGVPARLVFRRRRPERPDVVVLCDVSDSVRNVSRMMLLFVHTLQSLFTRVRSFAFVSDVGEITDLFKSASAAEAVDLSLAGEVISLHANSNYGRALSLFARTHLPSVTRRTTVLVIGDGRSNYHPPEAAALEEIARKARRVVWICPEEKGSWGIGDSEMLVYARKVTRVLLVQTLADLESAADAIVA